MSLLSDKIAEPQFVDLDEAQVAALLNAPELAGTLRLPTPTFAAKATILETTPAQMFLAKIEIASEVTGLYQVLCRTVVQALALENISTDVPANFDFIDLTLQALVDASPPLLDVATRAALLALSAPRPQSWAQANDWQSDDGGPGVVTSRDVGLARGHK